MMYEILNCISFTSSFSKVTCLVCLNYTSTVVLWSSSAVTCSHMRLYNSISQFYTSRACNSEDTPKIAFVNLQTSLHPKSSHNKTPTTKWILFRIIKRASWIPWGDAEGSACNILKGLLVCISFLSCESLPITSLHPSWAAWKDMGKLKLWLHTTEGINFTALVKNTLQAANQTNC